MNDQKRRACITRSDISRIYNAKPYPDDPFIWWLMQHDSGVGTDASDTECMGLVVVVTVAHQMASTKTMAVKLWSECLHS
ncbi:hypothetical protein T4B_1588 [Trichinella pseudospiralis]|uniref:Uncharacterized protein n=1 Tax=Trichinella pseudospiralis TaxID=6337 RepID=A0A0V1EGC9_TRIPS|nr:hypothetical protein T4A_276 [Trichinella pseudospiralis]KRZ23185.1 hypothetical protein T4B_1588 [Trichinella pseudospiralis]KRZ35551.1 hypothetical protein T4C_10486 [Trichinella pseudospiralis]